MRSLSIVLTLVVAAPHMWAEPAAPAEGLIDFKAVETGRARYRVDPALGERAEALIRIVDERLNDLDRERAEREAVVGDTGALLETLNQLIGCEGDEALRRQQRDLIQFFAMEVHLIPAPPGEIEITFTDYDNATRHLKAGGTLPLVILQEDGDGLYFKIERTMRMSDQPENRWLRGLTLALKKEQSAEESEQLVFFDLWRLQRQVSLSLALHEVAEYSLLSYGADGRTDPHWRWFSDGLANVLTRLTLEKHGRVEEAAEFRQGFDAGPFDDLRPELNLRYWLEAIFQPQMTAFGEKRLTDARYAFATAEMQRLVDEHGTAWIPAVVAGRLNDQKQLSTIRIIDAIRAATGVDMNDRLDAYQSFATVNEGVGLYLERFSTALAEERHGDAAVAAIRLLELQFDSIRKGPGGMQYVAIMKQLIFADEYRDGLAVMRQMKEIGLTADTPQSRLDLAMIAAGTAVTAGDLSLADGLIEPFRAAHPDHAMTMLYDAHAQSRAGDAAGAAALAKAALEQFTGDIDPELMAGFKAVAQRLIDAAPGTP